MDFYICNPMQIGSGRITLDKETNDLNKSKIMHFVVLVYPTEVNRF